MYARSDASLDDATEAFAADWQARLRQTRAPQGGRAGCMWIYSVGWDRGEDG